MRRINMGKVPRPKPPETPKQVSVQVPESWTLRLDRIAARMSAAAGGVPVRRADVLRLVIGRGMDALESERPTTEDKAGGKRRR
jgi:hypothetical protein